MKILSTIVLCLGIVAMTATSCKKDDTTTSDENVVSAKIDGVNFTADTIFAIVAGGSMSITSAKGAEKIILYIPATATTGSHPINFSTYNIMYFDNTGAIYNSQGGTITISRYDAAGKSIEGSFTQTMYNGAANKTLTEGVFKVKY